MLDSVELRTTDPQFTLELVEMRYETGAHDIYQLLHGETEIDGLEHPAAARELVHAMRAGLTLQGARARSSSGRSKASPASAASCSTRAPSAASSRTRRSSSTTS